MEFVACLWFALVRRCQRTSRTRGIGTAVSRWFKLRCRRASSADRSDAASGYLQCLPRHPQTFAILAEFDDILDRKNVFSFCAASFPNRGNCKSGCRRDGRMGFPGELQRLNFPVRDCSSSHRTFITNELWARFEAGHLHDPGIGRCDGCRGTVAPRAAHHRVFRDVAIGSNDPGSKSRSSSCVVVGCHARAED